MKKFCVLLLVVLLTCSVLSGCVPTFSELMGINHKSEEQQDADYEKKLKELLKLIDTVYVDDYDKTQLGDMLAAAAVAATGDRWSYYISAEEYASYLENSNKITHISNSTSIPTIY